MKDKVIIYTNGMISGMFVGFVAVYFDNQIPSEFSMWCAAFGLCVNAGFVYFTLRRD